MLSTRSLAWLDFSQKLYDHCKFLYVGLSISQLRFSPPHYSTQHHFLSLWFQFHVVFWLCVHPQEPWLGNRFVVLSYSTLYYFFFSCPTPLILKPCYSLHVGTWNLRVWGRNKATAVVPRTGGAAKLFSRPLHMQWPNAEIRLAPMRPHMLDIPICFCSLSFSPLKKPLPKPASNSNPIHS